jgi:hypothetical protein
LEDQGDGEAPIYDLQVRAGLVIHKDMKYVAHERFRVRDVTLKNMWAKLQIPPSGPFDMTDISWGRN